VSLDLSTLVMADSVPLLVRKSISQAQLLHSTQEVERAVDQMAVQLTVELQDQDPLLISVLQGGLVLAGMLLQRMVFPLQTGSVSVSSYGADTQAGDLEVVDVQCPEVNGKIVLLVDDVLDQGRTISTLVSWFLSKGARQVLVAVLVEKQVQRSIVVHADFVGLKVVDKFLMGFGMDHAGYGRNLPGIYAIGT